MHLDLGGPGHGTLTLDPDGNRITCTSASFLWHEMNAQGQVTSPNEEFEYKLGTFAPYAGAISDPQNPGALKPVWAVGEALGIEADAFDQNGVEQEYLNDVGVHVEPGQPDHFEWNSKDAIPPANEFHLWAGWGEVGIYEADAYFLDDQYGNHVWGFSNVSLTRQGGNPVNGSVYLADPSNPGGLTGDDSDYHLYFDTGSQLPLAAGTTTFTLTASASTGTVTQTVNFVVDGGTTKFVVIEPNQSTNWIYRVPVVAPPPYESIDICQPGQPRTDWTGSYVVEDQFGVFQGDHWPAHCGLDGSGGCDPGVSNLTSPDQFRLTLIDASFHAATDGVFEVAFPPDNSTDPLSYGGPWQQSSNGTLTITLPGKGYFWVRYPSMPHNPGVYTLLVEPLDSGYNTSTLKGYLSYAGTVVGAEILDQNFAPAPSPSVTQDTQFYIRYVDPSPSGDTEDVTFSSDEDTPDPNPIDVTLTRVGQTNVYIGPFVMTPDADPPPAPQSAQTQGLRRQMLGQTKRVRYGSQRHQARKAGMQIFTVPVQAPFDLSLAIDTSSTGQQPNLLLADGQDKTHVSATLVTPQGGAFHASSPVQVAAYSGSGSVSNVTAGPGPLAIYGFDYTTPNLGVNLNDTTVYRAAFQVKVGVTPYTIQYTPANPTPKYQWPMYYRGHDFKNMLEDSEFVYPGTILPDKPSVLAFLSDPLGTGSPSFLQDFYFVNIPDPLPADLGGLNFNGYWDVNRDHVYDAGDIAYCYDNGACLPLNVASQSTFEHVLDQLGPGFNVSAANLLVNLQKESQHLTSGTIPVGSLLDWAMGCGTGDPAANQGFFAQLACGAQSLANNFALTVDFFAAPTGVPNPQNPQWIRICGEPITTVAYQPANAASRAEARYTNTVIWNCPTLNSGTYSFAFWWERFFGGNP